MYRSLNSGRTAGCFSTTMLGHQFAHSAAPVRKVTEVQFGVLSPEEIVRMDPLGAEGQLTVVAESVLSRKDRASRGHGRGHSQTKTRRPHGPTHGHHRQEFQVSDLWRGHVRVSRSLWPHRTRTACFSSRCVHPYLFPIHPVSHSPGFIVKVKKILECICVNCGKLKADIVSRHPNSYSFRTPPPKFSGGSLRNPLENPKPAQR